MKAEKKDAVVGKEGLDYAVVLLEGRSVVHRTTAPTKAAAEAIAKGWKKGELGSLSE